MPGKKRVAYHQCPWNAGHLYAFRLKVMSNLQAGNFLEAISKNMNVVVKAELLFLQMYIVAQR